MSPQDITLVIAAGGKSERMGKDKRLLELGGKTLLERILQKGLGVPFKERLLSVAQNAGQETTPPSLGEVPRRGGEGSAVTNPDDRSKELRFSNTATLNRERHGQSLSAEALSACPSVSLTLDSSPRGGAVGTEAYHILCDSHPNCGPAEALRCALEASPTDWIFFVSADQPFLDLSVLLAQLCPATQDVVAIVPETQRRQYLAGLYHKSLLPELTRGITNGERRLRTLIPEAHTQFISFPPSTHPDVLFFNVNTPADFLLAQGRVANEGRNVPVVTITAPASNTGKTTFLERILQRLSDDGIRAGVVKGDAHGYQFDPEGKDSARFLASGAEAVAVVSPDGYFIEQRTVARRDLLDVAAKFDGVDLVLIESRAHGTFPALAIWRGLGDKTPPDIAVAQFTSEPDAEHPPVPVYDINDIDAAVKLVRFLCNM